MAVSRWEAFVANRWAASAALFLLLAACSTSRSVTLTGLNHPSGWADQIRTAAVEAFPYAQMSTNSYADDDRFDLGPDYETIVDEPNDSKGFAYSIFERRQGGTPAELIIAFRGTEFTHLNDWIFGNFLATQNRRGLRLYDEVDGKTDLPISVTGHSLGGAIATYISLRRENVRTYVFNSSPRFSRSGRAPANRRLSIVEYGELLKAARVFGGEPTQTYISINCTPGIDVLKGHGIRRLAAFLTRIAAWHSPAARRSLALNGLRWPVGLPRD